MDWSRRQSHLKVNICPVSTPGQECWRLLSIASIILLLLIASTMPFLTIIIASTTSQCIIIIIHYSLVVIVYSTVCVAAGLWIMLLAKIGINNFHLLSPVIPPRLKNIIIIIIDDIVLVYTKTILHKDDCRADDILMI